MPIVAIILGVIMIAFTFVFNNTTFGRHVYAVGGNSNAAVLSGVNSRRVNFLVIMNMGVLAAVAGIVYTAYAGASGPSDGTGWELDAIAAVFVGGAAVAGGIGTIPASIIGGLVLSFLANGLSLVGIDTNTTQIIRGLVLLVAVAFDVYNKTQGRPSLTGRLFRSRNQKSEGPTDGGIKGDGSQPESIADQPQVLLP